MIDLRKRELPSTIECEGKSYNLNTNFRVWIEFERCLREDNIFSTIIFENIIPPGTEWPAQALEFLQSPSITPRNIGKRNNNRAVDFVQDGDYIVSAFQSAYGIDLTSIDYMHWHRFKALLDGLPEDTKLSHIMGYRAWQKDNRKHDDIMREQQQIWRLPDTGEAEQLEAAQAIAERLYREEMSNG